jgi:hypothetical protein
MRSRLLSLAVVLSAFGMQALGAQAPVKTIEDGVLDKIELFVASPGGKDLVVVMKPFDTSKADLGTGGKDGKDARQQEAKTMQNEGPRVLAEHFVTGLEKSGAVKSVRALTSADDAVPDGALVVEGSFLTLDPGSRAKRYFAGFGAGKSSVKVTGTVKDSSGRTLARFEQRRVGTMGMGGGDSLGKLMADSGNIGEDIAKFLAKWARGDTLE